VRVAAIVIVLVGLGMLGVVGAGSLAQAPPPDPPPPVTTAPPGPATTAPESPPTTAPAVTTPAVTAPAGPSRAVGQPWHGRLVNGVQLPEAGPAWLTWDPVLKQIPNRPDRRWGTAKLIRTLERVLGEFHAAHPDRPPVLVGDLSRPHGGIFDERFGGLGHASHQNGLDADVYYPRVDGRPLAAYKPSLVDQALAQELVDRFVAAGAQVLFVGTRVGLTGPKKVVQVLAHHNDHVHVRIFPPRG
jgi:murein endopeptidase